MGQRQCWSTQQPQGAHRKDMERTPDTALRVASAAGRNMVPAEERRTAKTARAKPHASRCVSVARTMSGASSWDSPPGEGPWEREVPVLVRSGEQGRDDKVLPLLLRLAVQPGKQLHSGRVRATAALCLCLRPVQAPLGVRR